MHNARRESGSETNIVLLNFEQNPMSSKRIKGYTSKNDENHKELNTTA